MGNAFNEKEMINILSLKVEEMNGVLHSATEDTSSMLSEIDKLNNEVRIIDWQWRYCGTAFVLHVSLKIAPLQ